MKIALLHNPRPESTPPELPDDAFEEYDRQETLTAIAGALGGGGISVDPVVADRRLPWRLEEGRYDFAFNIAEGSGRRCREAIPVAVCELLDIPCTGSDALTLALTLDKALARRVVSPDIPVAPAVRIESEADENRLTSLHYPVIVKPNDEGSSKGIRDDAIAADPEAAIERARRLHLRYGCPVLVEEFLPGAEVTVGITGNGGRAAVLHMMEIEPVDDGPFVYSIAVKRDFRRRVRYHIPPRLPGDVLQTLERWALHAYRVLGCDFGRMDFRLDAAGIPRFLECNALPGLDPHNSDPVILAAPRLSYGDLVRGILRDAMDRVGMPAPAVAAGP